MAQLPTAVIKTSTLIEVREEDGEGEDAEEEGEEEGIARVYIEELKVSWGGWLGVTGHRIFSRHNGSQHIKAGVQKQIGRAHV